MPHPDLLGQRPVPPSFYKLTRRSAFVLGGLIALYLAIWFLFLVLNPNGPDPLKQRENEVWIATSHSWLDRISCRWLGICGGSNWLTSTWLFRREHKPQTNKSNHNHRHEWIDLGVNPGDWSKDEQASRKIPSFVLRHAPLIYLHEDEQWWPTDVADFMHHVQHRQEGRNEAFDVRLPTMNRYLPRDNLPGRAFLQSLDDPEELPDWITSTQNKPLKEKDRHRRTSLTGKGHTTVRHTGSHNGRVTGEQHRSGGWSSGFMRSQKVLGTVPEHASLEEEFENGDHKDSPGYHSSAPAFLITVEKENNTVDAFWFFFYAFNRGARVTGIQYGNHVGDWEHVLVRFQNGTPTGAFLSAHEWGSAYDFDVLERHGTAQSRPVVFAGLGSHAHYATPGKHAYALPFQLLADSCSRGHLWDPLLNLISFVHDPNAKGWPEAPKFKASMQNPRAHSSWLEYKGCWGDKRYTLGDPKGRNYRFAGELKYLSGPLGPWDKALDRHLLCEHADKECNVRKTRDGYVGPIKSNREIESFGS